MSPQSTASRLLKLPAELRNQIYELVFSSDGTTREISLDSISMPTPPTKSLKLVNRQLYRETRKMYQEAYRQFWESSSLVMVNGDIDVARAVLNTLAPDDIQHIPRVLLKGRVEGPDLDITTELLDKRGIWKDTLVFGSGRTLTRFYIRRGFGSREESKTRAAWPDSLETALTTCDGIGFAISVEEQIRCVLSGIEGLRKGA